MGPLRAGPQVSASLLPTSVLGGEAGLVLSVPVSSSCLCHGRSSSSSPTALSGHPIPCWALDPFSSSVPGGKAAAFQAFSQMLCSSLCSESPQPHSRPAAPDTQPLGPSPWEGAWLCVCSRSRSPLRAAGLLAVQELAPPAPLPLHAGVPLPSLRQLGQGRGRQSAARQIIRGSEDVQIISLRLWKVFLDLQLNVGGCDVLGIHNTSNQILKRNQQGLLLA